MPEQGQTVMNGPAVAGRWYKDDVTLTVTDTTVTVKTTADMYFGFEWRVVKLLTPKNHNRHRQRTAHHKSTRQMRVLLSMR